MNEILSQIVDFSDYGELLPLLRNTIIACVALGIVGAIRVAQPGGARQFKWRAWVALALVVVGLAAQWAVWRNTILVISAVVE